MTTSLIECVDCGAINRVPVVTSGRPRCATCHTDLPWLTAIDGHDFDAAIERSTLPVLVDLWAPWCGPCTMVGPMLDALSVELAGRMRIVKVNVDLDPDLSARLGVQGIPTMVLFRSGSEVARQVGALPIERLRSWIEATVLADGHQA